MEYMKGGDLANLLEELKAFDEDKVNSIEHNLS